MSDEPDYVFEDIWPIIRSKYRWCLEDVKREFAGLLSEEAPLQSACATIWIAVDKVKPTTAELVNRLKTRVAKLNSEAIPNATQVWLWHFKDFVNECGPRMTAYITHCVSQNMPPEEIESHVKEYLFRLRCEKLSIEEQTALGKEMFGDEY